MEWIKVMQSASLDTENVTIGSTFVLQNAPLASGDKLVLKLPSGDTERVDVLRAEQGLMCIRAGREVFKCRQWLTGQSDIPDANQWFKAWTISGLDGQTT